MTGDYTAAMVGADVFGAAATAQSNAESFATSAVATETTRAEAAESVLAADIAAGHLIATIAITSAQLLALSTTPIVIVPAPGAGKIIFPQSYMLEYLYGGTAYHTPLTTNNAFFGWTNEAINSTDAPIAFAGWGVFIEKTASVLAFGPVGNAANVGIVLANAENQGIQFGVPNALTLGNGTLKVTLVYSIITA